MGIVFYIQWVKIISMIYFLFTCYSRNDFKPLWLGLKNGDRQRHAVLSLMNKLIIYGLPRRRAPLLIHKICLPT